MGDYIKREDAIKTLEGWKISGEIILATVPSADVVERSSYESMEHTVAKLNEALSNSVEVIRCKDCKHWHDNTEFCDQCRREAFIDAQLTADVRENVSGEWISHDLENGEKSIDKDCCSVCGERFREIAMTGCEWNFCPNCGADMRGDNQ